MKVSQPACEAHSTPRYNLRSQAGKTSQAKHAREQAGLKPRHYRSKPSLEEGEISDLEADKENRKFIIGESDRLTKAMKRSQEGLLEGRGDLRLSRWIAEEHIGDLY